VYLNDVVRKAQMLKSKLEERIAKELYVPEKKLKTTGAAIFRTRKVKELDGVQAVKLLATEANAVD
jgi:hypothetical protein